MYLKLKCMIIFFTIFFMQNVYGAPIVKINKPNNGFTKKSLVSITGTVEEYNKNYAIFTYNGISRRIAINNKKFSTKLVLSRGDNLIEVIAEDKNGLGRDSVAFYADVPKRDIKIVLTWDTDKTDMDLWVRDPSGEKVYYSHKTSKIGGQLDIDVTTGYGPETFTLKDAAAGNYQIQVQNFSPRNNPLTKMRVFLILFEGTDKEERKTFNIISFRKSEVVNVVNFVIDGNLRFALK